MFMRFSLCMRPCLPNKKTRLHIFCSDWSQYKRDSFLETQNRNKEIIYGLNKNRIFLWATWKLNARNAVNIVSTHTKL